MQDPPKTCDSSRGARLPLLCVWLCASRVHVMICCRDCRAGRASAPGIGPSCQLQSARTPAQLQQQGSPGVSTSAIGDSPRSSMPRSSMQSKGQGEQRQREHRCRATKTRSSRHRYYHRYALGFALTCFVLAAAAAVPRAEGQQMDPAAMQRQIQQQMGGSPGGGGAPPPNRIGENGGCVFNLAAGLDVRARKDCFYKSGGQSSPD